MRRKYESPPINELVVGAYFKEPVLEMRAEHIGLFWSMLKDDYPNSMQNIMVGNVDIQSPNEIFPLPRFWFISRDDVYVLQVQKNAILLNWRRRDKEYPHYEKIKTQFDREYGRFISFLDKEFGAGEPAIDRCELNYINIVEDEPYFQSFADVAQVIPSFSPPTVGADDSWPSDFNLAYVYRMDAKLSLRLNVQSRRNSNTNKDALYFELRSTGALSRGTKSEADTLLDRAHDIIGEAFNGLTNAETQARYWQPKED